jgi:GTPase SAR1 family protein
MHNTVMQKEYKKQPPLEMGQSFVFGPEKLIIPEALQYLHFSFCGSSGSGKSTAIEELLRSALDRGDKAFIMDLGGAFYAKYGRPNDVILSLSDVRSEPWDFWSEESISENTMAQALVEENSGGQGNKFFSRAAQAVVAGILRASESLEELQENIRKPSQEIRKLFKENGDEAALILGEKSTEQSDGVMGTVALASPARTCDFLRFRLRCQCTM